MYGMESVGVGEKGVSPGAADSAHRDHLMVGQPHSLDGVVDPLVDPEVTATGTPRGKVFRTNGKHLRFFDSGDFFRKSGSRSLHE
ncbi:MAG: hypothetical protein K9N10_12245 [Deltaproteobacteria bacterium]|nr:hypothetical protein [Deltaproteobacteria bacterium]